MKRHGLQRIGHRGRPGNPRYGENTPLSFDLAFRAGATGIEYDVRKAQDGQLVVIHGDTLDHTTNGTGKVSDYTYKELCDFDAGYGEHIPLFEDMLYRYHERGFQNVEIKEKGIAEKILDIIECFVPSDPKDILVSSFDWDELYVFRRTIIPVALLADTDTVNTFTEEGFIHEALERSTSAINPHFTAVTQSLVELAHKAGLKVYPWTVNEEADIARMKELGVDGIISDLVERL